MPIFNKVRGLLKLDKTDIPLNNVGQENSKWELAVDITNIGVWEFDATINKVYFSESSKRIIGFENDTTFGSNVNDWNKRVHPDDREKYYKDYQDHLEGLKPIYINEHRVKCKDGTYKWILDKGKIIKWDDNGTPIRFLGTHIDITNLIENEIKISNTLNLVSKQNNRLKNFAHIVTHNLKQHASNFESLLKFHEESKSEKEKEDLLQYLKSLSASLTKTISNLHEIVSIQNHKPTAFKKLYLAEETDKILNMLNLVITENKATINNNINPKLFIYYNAIYLESIIQNLLTNAIKYKHPDRDPVATVSTIIKDEKLQVIVSDNGIGIDLEKYGDSIFGLYKTFHNNKDSEGVGLYLIKNQIETYGGKINVESTLNVGTTFTVTIPNKKSPV
ncbi:PAS domain S-box protein [Algibacter amylolyticus]|uniref:histidine kinase n=1 Tax=Algibacter amylolyticus TaxID=1608400 RepID=A0A5M7B5Q7_9FLAO|nr:PAS domain-containing protein [Algibacter amylolyticus]KAA5823647.1 PAS domain-containing protein [Algibacter amylolyticus]MBB5267810.1 PAS domain S-box-containing protein [Algibacter amylolyticus]TSJ74135.1 PAS domain S-box protein [Algibacter amylolyticus]